MFVLEENGTRLEVFENRNAHGEPIAYVLVSQQELENTNLWRAIARFNVEKVERQTLAALLKAI